MVRLKRTVRFSINPPGTAGIPDPRNGYAGKPPMQGLGRFYELEITVQGQPDPITGYLLNIKDIDLATQTHAIPIIETACREQPHTDPALLMPTLQSTLAAALSPASLESIRWNLTPYYSVEMTQHQDNHIILRQSFDFAAAHRLHVNSLSDEQNRATFGHCNNPAGHGHNYRIEPTIKVTLNKDGTPFSLTDLERATDDIILQRFDHTHLNQDTEEFGPDSGITPSVENMARVFFQLLAPAIADRSSNAATLQAMTVWETDRTSCTYPAP